LINYFVPAALAEIDSVDVVDGDEVMAWVDSWGTDNEKNAPEL
jgi:predicted transcriptional regulator